MECAVHKYLNHKLDQLFKEPSNKETNNDTALTWKIRAVKNATEAAVKQGTENFIFKREFKSMNSAIPMQCFTN